MNTDSIKSRLLELASQPGTRQRGDWSHYTCFKCDDHSAHLGINKITGQVKCLLCGFSYSLNTGLGNGHLIRKKDITGLATMFSYVCRPITDQPVLNYMTRRGIGAPETCGWAYGRANLIGRPVFPVYDHTGKVVYLQHRSIYVEHHGAYRSVGRTEPRLDCWPMLQINLFPSNLLILNEGPIDALSIRTRLHMWASPLFGMNVSPRLALDVKDAVDRWDIDRVVVMLDREKLAVTAAKMAAIELKRRGVPASFIQWRKLDNVDPDEMTNKALMVALTERQEVV